MTGSTNALIALFAATFLLVRSDARRDAGTLDDLAFLGEHSQSGSNRQIDLADRYWCQTDVSPEGLACGVYPDRKCQQAGSNWYCSTEGQNICYTHVDRLHSVFPRLNMFKQSLVLTGATPGDGNILHTLEVDATPRDVLKLFDLVKFTNFEYSHLHRGRVTNCNGNTLTLLFEQPQIQAEGNFPIKDVMRRYFLALCFQHSMSEEMGKFCRVVLNGFKESVYCPESVSHTGGQDDRAFDMKIASLKDGTELKVRDLFAVKTEKDKTAFKHADVPLCKDENEAAQDVALRAMQIMCAVGTNDDDGLAWNATIPGSDVYLPDWCYGSKDSEEPKIIDWVDEAIKGNYPCLNHSNYLDGTQSDLLPLIDAAKTWLNGKMEEANDNYDFDFLKKVLEGNISEYNKTKWDFIKDATKRNESWDNSVDGVTKILANGSFAAQVNRTLVDPSKPPMACVAFALIRSQVVNVIDIGGTPQVTDNLNSEKILERLNKVISRTVTVWWEGKPFKKEIESAPRALRNREKVGNLPSQLQALITYMVNNTDMKKQLNGTADNQMRTVGVFGHNNGTKGLNPVGLENFKEYFQNEFFRMQAVLNEQSGNVFKVMIEAPFTVTVSMDADGCLSAMKEGSLAVKTDVAKLIGPGGQPILGVDIARKVLDDLKSRGGLASMFVNSGVIECVLNQMNEQHAGSCPKLKCGMQSIASPNYI